MWTDYEVKQLLEMRAEGKTIKECGILLGKPYDSVRTKLNKMKQLELFEGWYSGYLEE